MKGFVCLTPTKKKFRLATTVGGDICLLVVQLEPYQELVLHLLIVLSVC
jgi:hypothetical protein